MEKELTPKRQPAYQTAFLFLDDYDESAVPPWAMRLRLEPEDILAGKKKERDQENRYEYQTGKRRDQTYGAGVFEAKMQSGAYRIPAISQRPIL